MKEFFESAREEMMNISEWMRINKLSINPQKTEYMIIGHPRRTNKISSHEPLMLNGAEIKRAQQKVSKFHENFHRGNLEERHNF